MMRNETRANTQNDIAVLMVEMVKRVNFWIILGH